MSAALGVHRALTTLAEPLLPALLRRRAARGREDPARLPERLARDTGARPAGRLVWLHGASVGEGLSLLPLVDALRAAAPDTTLLVTTGTTTAAALLARRLPADVLHRYAPVDAPGVARRFTAHWRPDLAVFAESELWPNLLREVRAAGAATALVSARLSERSLAGWARAPAAARAVIGGFRLVMAQDDAVAAALVRLGARDDGRLNLKLAGAAPPFDADALAQARAQAAGAPLLLAASTHPGEDEVVLDAFARLARPDALLVIAPRHPDRGRAVEELARARGLDAALRSVGCGLRRGEVHVADTLGELGLWFELARGGSTFVGGSLAPGVGGHNPVEPVRAGAPLVRGPHVENWTDVHARLGDAAPPVADAEALARAWAHDLDEPAAATRRAALASERLQGDDANLAEAVRRLVALLPEAP